MIDARWAMDGGRWTVAGRATWLLVGTRSQAALSAHDLM
jgi:hypothetical protein